MGKIIQNTIIVVGFLLLAAVGYYLYIQNENSLLVSTEIDPELEAKTATFLARQRELQTLSVETGLFRDPRFTTLRSFTTPVPPLPQGRANPFLPVSGTSPEPSTTSELGDS